MNLLEKSILIAEKCHDNTGELQEKIETIIERYERFVNKALKLAEDYEKEGKERLSKKFYNMAEKYDEHIKEAKIMINNE